MTDNRDEPDIQNSGISNEAETTIQTPILTDDKTLLLSTTPIVETIDEPTRKFTKTVDKQAQTAIQNAPDTEPTKIFSGNKTENEQDEPEIEATDEAGNGRDENGLRPSRLRFALVCFLFVLAFVQIIGLIYQDYLRTSETAWTAKKEEQIWKIYSIEKDYLKDKLQLGDEIISLNGQPFTGESFYKAETFEQNEPYTLEIKRNGVIQSVEIVNIKSVSLQGRMYTIPRGCQEFCVIDFSVSPGIGIRPSKIIAI